MRHEQIQTPSTNPAPGGSDTSSAARITIPGLDNSQQQKIVALDDGRIFVHDQAKADAAIISAIRRLRNDQRFALAKPEYVSLESLSVAANGGLTVERRSASLGVVNDSRGELLTIINLAAQNGANDIQFSVRDNSAYVRLEIDGFLTQKPVRVYTADQANGIMSAALNMSDSGASQPDPKKHQKFSIIADDKLPPGVAGIRGQTVVLDGGRHMNLRLILKPSDNLPNRLQDFGFTAKQLTNLYDIQTHSAGLFTVVGPTGSGKSHLKNVWLFEYSELRNHTITVAQIADPHEYKSPLFLPIKIEATDDADVDPYYQAFMVALRIAPHVIDFNEVRSSAAALSAFKTARTSKLIPTTLHCEDIFQIPQRYIETGVDEKLAYSPQSHIGWHAQRLLPRLCPHCKRLAPEAADDDQLDQRRAITIKSFLKAIPERDHQRIYVHGDGCAKCSNGDFTTLPGINGRVLAAENTIVTAALLGTLQKDYFEARRQFIKEGGTTLTLHAYDHMLDGLVGIDEFNALAGSASKLKGDLDARGNT